MLKILRGLFFGFIIVYSFQTVVRAQYVHSEKPLLEIIEELEEKTSYRFLYRSALLSDIKLTISATESAFFDKLNSALRPFDLYAKVDEERKQVIILILKNDKAISNRILVKGQVVDALTGERLPFATVSWVENEEIKGVVTNESGVYSIDRSFKQEFLEITCSFFGYSPNTLQIDISETTEINDLTCRLDRNRIDVNQLVVIGSNYYDDLNSQSSSILDIGDFSPMGENSSVSALQSLPSVSLSTLMDGALQVRGSPADGFRVLVDEVTIYNQSHLYGLVDSFNGDILQRAGFYYDIAPVKIQAPPGGTLSLVTKSGSMNKISGSAGISNSSLRFSVDALSRKGKAVGCFLYGNRI